MKLERGKLSSIRNVIAIIHLIEESYQLPQFDMRHMAHLDDAIELLLVQTSAIIYTPKSFLTSNPPVHAL